MAKIISKKQLSPAVYQIRVEAPLIAEERKAGQFIILQVDKDIGERVPLTIADADTKEGSITLIFQTVGKTTQQLATLEEGDDIPVIVGSTIIFAYLLAITVFLLDFVYALVDPRVKVGG